MSHLQRAIPPCSPPWVREEIGEGGLVRESAQGPLMVVLHVGGGWAFCSWFDEDLRRRQGSFPLPRLRQVGHQTRH